MNVAFIIIGVFMLTFTIVDLLWTTLWVDGGAGPLSARLTTWIWRGLRKLGGQHSRVLSLAGPIMLVNYPGYVGRSALGELDFFVCRRRRGSL